MSRNQSLKGSVRRPFLKAPPTRRPPFPPEYPGKPATLPGEKIATVTAVVTQLNPFQARYRVRFDPSERGAGLMQTALMVVADAGITRGTHRVEILLPGAARFLEFHVNAEQKSVRFMGGG